MCEDVRDFEFDEWFGDKYRGSDGSECKYDSDGSFSESESTFNYEPDYRNPAPFARHLWKDFLPELVYGHESEPYPTLQY
jgi:hypothetical protein